MTINKSQNGSTLVIALEGRLDTMTAPELEAELNASLKDAEALVMDFSKLEYAKEGMTVKNVNEIVAEVFEVTGFADILNIE